MFNDHPFLYYASRTMTEEIVLTQKRAGIILIVFGMLLAIAVGIPWTRTRDSEDGFPSMLPADDTILYGTFPEHTDEHVLEQLSTFFQVDWAKKITPWMKDGAFVLMAPTTETDAQKLLPVFLSHVTSKELSQEFLLTYRNPERSVRELTIEGIQAYSTPALTFAFMDDVVIVSPWAPTVGRILSAQAIPTLLLGKDRTFIQLRRSAPGDYFIFTRPGKLPPTAHAWIASRIKPAPFFMRANSALSIGLIPTQSGWLGSSVAIPEIPIERPSHSPYRAHLPPYFPAEHELFISGQDLAGQLGKIMTLTPILQNFAAEYLPGIDVARDLFPLLGGESGLSVLSDSFLFISESLALDIGERLKKIWEALGSIAGKWTPRTRTLQLPDGSEAAELVPDQSKIQTSEADFQGILIRSIQPGNERSLHLAYTQQKIFFSNDLSNMQRALELTKAPGESLRDSPTYKTSLQPILKNPELLGVFTLDGMVFSFSKRTLSDRTETNFKLVLE